MYLLKTTANAQLIMELRILILNKKKRLLNFVSVDVFVYV